MVRARRQPPPRRRLAPALSARRSDPAEPTHPTPPLTLLTPALPSAPAVRKLKGEAKHFRPGQSGGDALPDPTAGVAPGVWALFALSVALGASKTADAAAAAAASAESAAASASGTAEAAAAFASTGAAGGGEREADAKLAERVAVRAARAPPLCPSCWAKMC